MKLFLSVFLLVFWLTSCIDENNPTAPTTKDVSRADTLTVRDTIVVRDTIRITDSLALKDTVPKLDTVVKYDTTIPVLPDDNFNKRKTVMTSSYSVSNDTLTKISQTFECVNDIAVPIIDTTVFTMQMKGNQLFLTDVGDWVDTLTRIGNGTQLFGDWLNSEGGVSTFTEHEILMSVSQKEMIDVFKLEFSRSFDYSGIIIDTSKMNVIYIIGTTTHDTMSVSVNSDLELVYTSSDPKNPIWNWNLFGSSRCEDSVLPPWFLDFFAQNTSDVSLAKKNAKPASVSQHKRFPLNLKIITPNNTLF